MSHEEKLRRESFDQPKAKQPAAMTMQLISISARTFL
jgi:hypothetical protein